MDVVDSRELSQGNVVSCCMVGRWMATHSVIINYVYVGMRVGIKIDWKSANKQRVITRT